MLDQPGFGTFGGRFAEPGGRKFEMARLISQALSDEGRSRRCTGGWTDLSEIDFSSAVNQISLPD